MPKKPNLGRLEQFDDDSPAGPYLDPIDDCALRLICLAVIDQAKRDVINNHESAFNARHWLQEDGLVWLKALGVRRAFGDDRLADIFRAPSSQSILNPEGCDRYLPEDR